MSKNKIVNVSPKYDILYDFIFTDNNRYKNKKSNVYKK